jgi:hypothetical protein
MGGEVCAPSGRQRPGQAAAVVEVLGAVDGVRPPHPTAPSGKIYDRMSDGGSLDEVKRFYAYPLEN